MAICKQWIFKVKADAAQVTKSTENYKNGKILCFSLLKLDKPHIQKSRDCKENDPTFLVFYLHSPLREEFLSELRVYRGAAF